MFSRFSSVSAKFRRNSAKCVAFVASGAPQASPNLLSARPTTPLRCRKQYIPHHFYHTRHYYRFLAHHVEAIPNMASIFWCNLSILSRARHAGWKSRFSILNLRKWISSSGSGNEFDPPGLALGRIERSLQILNARNGFVSKFYPRHKFFMISELF